MMRKRCEHVRENLSRFLDNDLSGRQATAIAAHLDDCLGCRHEYDALRAVRQTIQTTSTASTPPDAAGARERVFARFEQAVHETPPVPAPAQRIAAWTSVLPTWRRPSAGGTLLAALGIAGIAFLLLRPTPETAPTKSATPSLPGDREISLLFDLHDAHVGGLTSDDPVLRRSQAAEAHASLIQRADETIAESL
jgi:anti-sigma factor RsiW